MKMNTKWLLKVLLGSSLVASALARFQNQQPISFSASSSSSKSPPSTIPSIGFGTWRLEKHNASEAVSVAIQTGYRHIDCAAVYGNEREVGQGVIDGLKKSGLQREDIWVTSKLWNDQYACEAHLSHIKKYLNDCIANSHCSHDPDLVRVALEQTLTDLGLEYLDLYLMHWPVASENGKTFIDYIDVSKIGLQHP